MKKYFLFSILALSAISCRMDDNLNPNKVLSDQVLPNLRLAGATTSAYAVQAGLMTSGTRGGMNTMGQAWMNSWSGNFAQYGNPFTTESDLNFTTTYRQSIFSDTYKAVTRLQRVIDFGNSYPNYVAIAKIQKAYYMQYIVDLYGNVPYTEAFKEADNPTPKYDKDIDVYAGLVAELTDAVNLINANSTNTSFAVISSSDPVFKGNMTKWKEFANTVLLKFAVRLSNTTDPQGVALRGKILTALSGANFITYDVTINPGYVGSSAETLNPLYGTYGIKTASGQTNTDGYLLMTASDHAIKTLLGDTSKMTSGVSDPRIDFLFTKAKKYNNTAAGGETGYYGFPQGMSNDNYKVFMGFTVDARKPLNENFSFLAGMYTSETGGSSNGIIMMKSEAEFLLTEAALRGYTGFSSAQTHFESAVKASFTFDGKTAAEATSYLTSVAAKPKVGWTGSNEDKIAAIQYQRWVALMNYNGAETYINYLRTGYPVTPLATTATAANKPYRLMYPAEEYSSNSANVPVLTKQQCFVKNEFTPFIYK